MPDDTKTPVVLDDAMALSKINSSEQDSRDMEVGDMQEVDVNKPLQDSFNIWSALGLQYSMNSTPLAVGIFLASVIGVGGSPVFIFGYIFAVGCNMCICVSLAEIAAVYPHTSGKLDLNTIPGLS